MPAPPPALIAAPYTPPRCKIGGTLACTLRGDVPVDGMTAAPIAWPFTRYRGDGVPRCPFPMLIVCGDLERALRTESGVAVAYYWGIHCTLVARMRRALGIAGRTTEGLARLRSQRARFILTNITPRQLAAIRADLAAGKKPTAISDARGVPRRAIYRIRRGDTFAE